jgi:hypothetical protein
MDEESTCLKHEISDTRVLMASETLEGSGDSEDEGKEKGEEAPAAQISRLRAEIGATRDELGSYLTELDRRRHEALDLRLQVRRHPGVLIAVGVAIAAVTAGVVVRVVRARRPETVERKVQQVPSRIAPPPPDPWWVLKLLVHAALPIGVAVAKSYLTRRKSRQQVA